MMSLLLRGSLLIIALFNVLSAQEMETPDWEELSYFYIEDGNFKQALAIYDSVLQADSTIIQAHLLRIDAYVKLNNPKKVLTLTQQLRKIHKNNALPLRTRVTLSNYDARAYLQINKADSAILILEKQVKLQPNRYDTFFLLAESYQKKNLHGKSHTAIVKCISLYPRFIPAHLFLAELSAQGPDSLLTSLPLAYALTLDPYQDSAAIIFQRLVKSIQPALSSNFLANPSSQPQEIEAWLSSQLAIVQKKHKSSIWSMVYGKFYKSLLTKKHTLAYFYFLQQALKDSAKDHWILANTKTMEPFYWWLSYKLPPEEIPIEED